MWYITCNVEVCDDWLNNFLGIDTYSYLELI